MPVRKTTKKTTKKVEEVVLDISLDVLEDTLQNRKLATILLNDGKKGQFWQFLTKILDRNIQVLTDSILNDEELTEEQRFQKRWRRKYQLRLRNLPDELLRIYDPEKYTNKDDGLDPYDKPVDNNDETV